MQLLLSLVLRSITAWSIKDRLAVGQFLNYRSVLRRQQPKRQLYLAVSIEVYESFFAEELPKIIVDDYQIKILIFDPETVEVAQWIN